MPYKGHLLLKGHLLISSKDFFFTFTDFLFVDCAKSYSFQDLFPFKDHLIFQNIITMPAPDCFLAKVQSLFPLHISFPF